MKRLRLASCVLVVAGAAGVMATAQEPPASSPGATTVAAPGPPDGRWLVDERGRQYYLEPIPKAQVFKQDDGTYRAAWGIPVEVVREDDQSYYFKVYKTAPVAPGVGAEPTPADIAKMEASYRADVPTSSRFAFAPFATGLPTSGQWRDGFDVADMNGDGFPDIVHGPARKSMTTPTVFLGDGEGTWRRWSEASYPPLPYDYGDAKVGDFNGDGRPDLALAVHLKGFIVLLGDGAGRFTAASTGLDFNPNGQGFSSRTLRVADWNGDGRPDILALSEGPQLQRVPGQPLAARPTGIVAYLNRSDGSWERRTGERTELFGEALAVGDLNGDHRPDIATGSSVMGWSKLVHLGDASGGWRAEAVEGLRPRAVVRSIGVADLNRDGRDDLAVGYVGIDQDVWWTGVDVFYSAKDGAWTRRVLASEEGRDGVAGLATGDLDADGAVDVVALTGDGRLWVFRGDGQGFFTRDNAPAAPFATPCGGSAVRLADLNGDGRDDVVATYAEDDGGLLNLVEQTCSNGGGLAAWTSVPPDAGGTGTATEKP